MTHVRDIMTSRIRYVSPDAKLTEAARFMKEHDLGSLPVIQDDKVVGVVTDRDIVVRAIADGRQPEQATVCSVMTEHPVCCYEDQKIDEVAKMMGEQQVRRVVVLNRDEQVAGMCSLGDVATGASDQTTGQTLEQVSQPAVD